MPIWTIIMHLGSIITLVTTVTDFIKSVIATKKVPGNGAIEGLLEAMRGLVDSGLIPLTASEQAGLDAAFLAIEAQFKT